MQTEIDEKDRKLLEVLKEHSDYTTRQLSRATLLPPTTIHNRLRKLRSLGVIKRFTVEVDHAKLGRGFVAYVLISASLELLKQKRKSQYDLAKELKRFDFVERVDIVSGGTDLIAIVRVRDVEEFDRVLLTKLQMLEGISRTQSLIVLHREG